MLRRTPTRLMQRTRPALFTENQQREMKHPYVAPPKWMKESVPTPPFTTFGMVPALVLLVIYIFYDKFFGYSSLAEHHHCRWNYGMFGKRVSYPANGTSFAYNCPGLSPFGSYNSWNTAGAIDRISPFLDERIPGKAKGDHGHH